MKVNEAYEKPMHCKQQIWIGRLTEDLKRIKADIPDEKQEDLEPLLLSVSHVICRYMIHDYSKESVYTMLDALKAQLNK